MGDGIDCDEGDGGDGIDMDVNDDIDDVVGDTGDDKDWDGDERVENDVSNVDGDDNVYDKDDDIEENDDWYDKDDGRFNDLDELRAGSVKWGCFTSGDVCEIDEFTDGDEGDITDDGWDVLDEHEKSGDMTGDEGMWEDEFEQSVVKMGGEFWEDWEFWYDDDGFDNGDEGGDFDDDDACVDNDTCGVDGVWGGVIKDETEGDGDNNDCDDEDIFWFFKAFKYEGRATDLNDGI